MKTGTNALGKYVSFPYWTEGAIRCYERGCVCGEDCGTFQILGRNCNMKACVLETVRNLGIPTEENGDPLWKAKMNKM